MQLSAKGVKKICMKNSFSEKDRVKIKKEVEGYNQSKALSFKSAQQELSDYLQDVIVEMISDYCDATPVEFIV